MEPKSAQKNKGALYSGFESEALNQEVSVRLRQKPESRAFGLGIFLGTLCKDKKVLDHHRFLRMRDPPSDHHSDAAEERR